MVDRPVWSEKIQSAWNSRSLVWLSGVRRVGKTTLAKSFSQAEYLNCDLPSSQRALEDPEGFFRGVGKKTIILDEVHQLSNPSRVLKIGADEFPETKILATGSSTLAATNKFRDSLTGRKYEVHLLPVLLSECASFGVSDIRRRLFLGGLPEALLAERKEPEFYIEWLDSYFARDIQELFRVDKRQGFLQTAETLFRQSGSLFQATGVATHVGIGRPTVMNYLEILQVTHLLTLLRPFHGGGRQELVRQPKAYAFDTGFVSYYRGWNELRQEDLGPLWENLVLDELRAQIPGRQIHFWRDKQGHEVDFVLDRGGGVVDAVECKWNPDAFEPKALEVFRRQYPNGTNYVVSPQVTRRYQRSVKGLSVVFCRGDHRFATP